MCSFHFLWSDFGELHYLDHVQPQQKIHVGKRSVFYFTDKE